MCVSDKIVENGTLFPTYKCLRPQLRRCFWCIWTWWDPQITATFRSPGSAITCGTNLDLHHISTASVHNSVGRFNNNISSNRYRNSHRGDKTSVFSPRWEFVTGKTAYSYSVVLRCWVWTNYPIYRSKQGVSNLSHAQKLFITFLDVSASSKGPLSPQSVLNYRINTVSLCRIATRMEVGDGHDRHCDVISDVPFSLYLTLMTSNARFVSILHDCQPIRSESRYWALDAQ